MKAKRSTKRKFSLSMKIVSMLSCLAIVSVGFASWWIVNLPTETTTQVGSFEVHTVSEKNITLTVNTNANTQPINFGKSTQNPATTIKWLGFTGTDTENLTAEFSFTIKLESSDNDALSDYISGVEAEIDIGSIFPTLVTANYLASPKVTYKVGNGNASTAQTLSATDGKNVITIPSTDMSAKEAIVTLSFEFDWGTVTGGANPFDYFNTKSQTDTNAVSNKTEKETAMLMLKALYGETGTDGLNGQSYSVKLTAKPVNN